MSARARSRASVHTLARVYTHTLSRTTTRMDAELRDLTDEELGRVIIPNRRIRMRSGEYGYPCKAAVISHDAPDGSAFTVLTYPPPWFMPLGMPLLSSLRWMLAGVRM